MLHQTVQNSRLSHPETFRHFRKHLSPTPPTPIPAAFQNIYRSVLGVRDSAAINWITSSVPRISLSKITIANSTMKKAISCRGRSASAQTLRGRKPKKIAPRAHSISFLIFSIFKASLSTHRRSERQCGTGCGTGLPHARKTAAIFWAKRRLLGASPRQQTSALLSLSPLQPSKPRPSFSLQARLAADACVRLGSGAAEPLFA